jgi:hypothetical protein
MVPCTGKILTNPELRLKGLNNMPRSIHAPLVAFLNGSE